MHVLLIGMLASHTALAASDTLADGMRHCTRETDAAQRLACFDSLTKTLPKAEVDQFGMTAAIAEQRDPGVTQRAKEETISAKIVALQQNAEEHWIFTLDNGQVWIQSEVRPGVRFEVGDAVHLQHGAMSSLWLAADHGRMTKVKRVR